MRSSSKDAVGTIIEWNPGAERLYGYSAEEAVGHPISILVPPERSGEEIKLLRRALGGAVITQFETERLRRDGNRVEVSLTISPIHDAQGEPAGASVIARDIGERKQAERALCASLEDLRRQSELLAGMIENAPIGMAIVSPKGRWLHVNRSLSEIVGYSEAELLQMSFQEVTHPDDRDSHRAMVEQLLAGEVGSYELEKRYVRKDGEVVWVRLSVSLVRDEHGEPLPSLPGLRAPRRRGPDGRHLGGAGRRAGRLWVRESLPLPRWELPLAAVECNGAGGRARLRHRPRRHREQADPGGAPRQPRGGTGGLEAEVGLRGQHEP